MDQVTQQRKAKRLFVVWIFLVLPVYLYSGWRKFATDVPQLTTDIYTILLIVAIGVFYFPMLLKINKEAKKGKLRWLVICTRILLFMFGGVLLLSPIAFLISIIAQNR